MADRGRGSSGDRADAWREHEQWRSQHDGEEDPWEQPAIPARTPPGARPQRATLSRQGRDPRARSISAAARSPRRPPPRRRQGLARLVALAALLLAIGVVVLVVVDVTSSGSPPPARHVVKLRTTNVTIIPGDTRRKLNRLLRSQGVKGSYWKDTRSSPLLSPQSYGAPASVHSLEGFLFPDTYNLRAPISIPALVADQLKNFKQKFKSINLSYAREHRLSPYDVLTIASMVEAEAAKPHDRALVASVIYNRLRLGMPLQIDATTRYATGNYTRPLTQSQLHSSSPYNTRTHTGLPPTPINSPGLASIQAAAHPTPTGYLYFVVKPCGNGALVFSSNYQQFLADSARYQQLRSQLGRSPTHC